MDKVYKLIIPIRYQNVLAKHFSEYDGMTFVPTKNDNEFTLQPKSERHFPLIDIPIELQPILLHEIEGDPISAEKLEGRKERDHELRRALKLARKAYSNFFNPSVTSEEFDKTLQELYEELNNLYPHWKNNDSRI